MNTIENDKISRVCIVFKTHLDIGFTNYAGVITEKYLHEYIPNAIRVGYELKDSSTPFVWTVGSWLVDLALKKNVPRIREALDDGIIRWHALPFTTHTEAMSPKLFQYGLAISKKLDETFGVKTESAKMTDVPGHTIGMIPYMKKAGINFMHIGVNPATPVPEVPRLFRWKCGEDSIVVMYQGDYGTPEIFGDTALEFAHTHDNEGPQTADEVRRIYADYQRKYPNAEIQAISLEEFGQIVLEHAKDLPVIDREIGDTWIHGVATDPKKLGRYRAILRYLDEHEIEQTDLTDNLLLVPEHTWGMDVKTFFRDETHYFYDELLSIAKDRQTIERSWEEQREYVRLAEHALEIHADYEPVKPDFEEFEEIENEDPGIRLVWQLHDRADYERWKQNYLRLQVEWSIWDFTKVGLPDYRGGFYPAKLEKTYKKGNRRLYLYKFDEEIVKQYGLPYFTVEKEGEHLTVQWFDKKISRLPQTFYLKFTEYGENWQLNKMNQWIKPEDVIGSPLYSAVYEGIENSLVKIESLDAALVAPFGKNILNHQASAKEQDMHFVLYTNVWNTNFPQWYGEDSLFRFKLKKNKNTEVRN